MSLRDRIADDLRAAMKAGDRARTEMLRMLRARVLEAEVEQRGKKGRDYALTDDETLQVLRTYAKQRRDSIDAFRKGGREDLASKEEAELALLQVYLPQQMSREEVRRIVREAVAECGAASLKDLGGVMRLVMPRLKNAADGKLVQEIVKETLSGG